MERLDKILANYGYTSRRNTDDFLKSNIISVNNIRTFDNTQKSDPHFVSINNEPIDHPDGIFIMLNKPAGYVCSHDIQEGKRVYDLLPSQWMKRNPIPSTIGRLDKDTTGILLITDRTGLNHSLAAPSHHVDKQYIAKVDKALDISAINQFSSGTLQLKGEQKPCLPASLEIIEIIDPTTARVTIHEGKYHQVKRMFSALGYTVLSLHRESFGKWSLGDCKEGQWKDCNL